MKVFIVLVTFFTLVLIGLAYRRDHNTKKFVTTLGMFGALWTFAVLGMMIRPVIWLFLIHLVLIIFSWLSIIWYIFRGRYYPYFHLSPLVTLVLYVMGEFLFGSAGLDLS